MMDRTDLQKAIDKVEHRIECASKAVNDSTLWGECEANEGDDFVGTYQEWIGQSFEELRAAACAQSNKAPALAEKEQADG